VSFTFSHPLHPLDGLRYIFGCDSMSDCESRKQERDTFLQWQFAQPTANLLHVFGQPFEHRRNQAATTRTLSEQDPPTHS
jgi:hypothetical protein